MKTVSAIRLPRLVIIVIGVIGCLAILILAAGCRKRIPKNRMDYLRSGKFEVALDAARTISREGPSAVPQIVEVLADPNPTTRWAAAASLCLIGTSARDAVPTLQSLAQGDKDISVRNMAKLALNQIGGPQLQKAPSIVSVFPAAAPGGISLSAKAQDALDAIAGGEGKGPRVRN